MDVRLECCHLIAFGVYEFGKFSRNVLNPAGALYAGQLRVQISMLSRGAAGTGVANSCQLGRPAFPLVTISRNSGPGLFVGLGTRESAGATCTR